MRKRKYGCNRVVYNDTSFSYFNEIEDKWINNLHGPELQEAYKKYCFDLVVHTIKNFSINEKIESSDRIYIESFSENFIALTEQFRNSEIPQADFKKKTSDLIKEAHTILDKYSGLRTKLFNLAFILGSILSAGALNIYTKCSYGCFFPSFAPNGSFENELINLNSEVQQVMQCKNGDFW